MTFSPDDPVLLTPREMTDVDRFAVDSGLASLRLIERAGRAVALAAERAAPKRGRIAILCGPGNNGGDGFVAARHLATWGFDVRVGCLVPVSALTGDAAEMARRWTGNVAPMDPALLQSADVVVDALFGAGLSRPLDGIAATMVSAMSVCSVPVIAVDVPSGLDGETGAFLGPVLKAAETVTFVRAKPGHYLLPGRIACGRLVVADIGIGDTIVARSPALQYLNSPPLWRAALPTTAADAHKYTRGHAVVVSGPAETTGAARL
ncbi:MAG TPA: NAD(P)H-hydrate epimerase, partial [Hyphomicrobiaceae bacterium]|nr:NAD(P)H-hydrate epimerase [Hyphomicrobiaceae bacterium]